MPHRNLNRALEERGAARTLAFNHRRVVVRAESAALDQRDAGH